MRKCEMAGCENQATILDTYYGQHHCRECSSVLWDHTNDVGDKIAAELNEALLKQLEEEDAEKILQNLVDKTPSEGIITLSPDGWTE